MRLHCSMPRAVPFAAVLMIAPAASMVSAQEPPSEEVEIIAQGAELFARNCQRCHKPRNPAERSDREWVIIMQHMETRSNMTLERIRMVRAFLLASNEAARSPGRVRTTLAPAPRPEEIDGSTLKDGREVFQSAGGCAACHGSNLAGGPLAPNLKDGVWKSGDGSLPAILNVVRNGVEGTTMAAYPGGISDEMAVQVAAYVWAVGHGRAQP